MIRLNVLISFALLLPELAHSQIHLAGPQSDTLVAGTYIVERDIWVEDETIWYLSPGVHLRFAEGTRLVNHGALYAIGSAQDSIRFESLNDQTSWRGIFFGTTHYWCYLDYCVITGCSETAVTVASLAALTTRHSRISHNSAGPERAAGYESYSATKDTLLDVVLSENDGHGLIRHYTESSLESCTVSNNTGTGIIGDYATLNVRKTDLLNNQKSGCYLSHSGAYFDSCTFIGNRGRWGGAIDIEGIGARLNRCFLMNNYADSTGGAIRAKRYAQLSIINSNFILNDANKRGSTLHAWGGVLINNVFVGNSEYATIFIEEDGMFCYSSLFSGQSNPVEFGGSSWIADAFGVQDSINVNGTACDRFGNLFCDPKFLDPAKEDFRLRPDSPCINAGTIETPYSTVELPVDPDGSPPDIGWQTYTPIEGWSDVQTVESPNDFTILKTYPNPFNSSILIRIEVHTPGWYICSVHSILGRQVYKEAAWLEEGVTQYKWSALGRHASGSYFVRIQGPTVIQTRKVVLLR